MIGQEVLGVFVLFQIPAINLLGGVCSNLHPCYNLVREIHVLHANTGNLVWNHVLREANQVVNDDIGYHVFEFAPSFILNALRAD